MKNKYKYHNPIFDNATRTESYGAWSVILLTGVVVITALIKTIIYLFNLLMT